MAAGACYTYPLSKVQQECYTYNHIYNNLVHNVTAYYNGGNHIYTDAGSCKNTIESNLLLGAPHNGGYIYHHCGLDNLSKNNIIHRYCKKKYSQVFPQQLLYGTNDIFSALPNMKQLFDKGVYIENE